MVIFFVSVVVVGFVVISGFLSVRSLVSVICVSVWIGKLLSRGVIVGG